jgi:esterase/lipase superfamily enzyme
MDVHNQNSQPAYELSMYKMDQRTAETIGPEAFLALLSSLAGDPPRRITLIGHSMGCHLLQHALMQNSWAFQRVRAMFWLAPDVDVDVLADDSFLGAAHGLQEGLRIHYSAHDNILTGLSSIANGKHRIGAVGHGSHKLTTPKIRFTDMTSALGTENVHEGYLLAGSASARQIAAQLTQP